MVDMARFDIVLASVISAFLAIVGKIVWDWFLSGRTKTGDYYMSIKACEQNRQNCSINDLQSTLAEHIQQERGNDSEVNTRLKNIEKSLTKSQEADEKLQGHLGKLEKAVTKIATILDIYVQRSDDRDRRTDEIKGIRQ